MLKICPQCGKEFKTYNKQVFLCSRACAYERQKRPVALTCDNCGKGYERPGRREQEAKKNHFCTFQCHQEWRKKNQFVTTCKVCGKEFHPQNTKVRHCSSVCRNAGLVTAQMLKCQQCGKEFRAFAAKAKLGRKFCSHACSETWMTGNRHPNYRGGRHFAHGSKWKRVRRQVIERDKVCRWCGATSSAKGRSLHVHHVDARRHYLIIDIANELHNLVTLCSSCHAKVEMAINHRRTAALPKFLRPPG